MATEIRIPHSEIQDSQTITERQRQAFREKGLDMSKNEVDELVDDHSTKTRILKVRNVQYFDMGRRRG